MSMMEIEFYWGYLMLVHELVGIDSSCCECKSLELSKLLIV